MVQPETINLGGKWHVSGEGFNIIPNYKQVEDEQTAMENEAMRRTKTVCRVEGDAFLPGTLDESVLGYVGMQPSMDRLERRFAFAGVCRYEKTVYIPHSWRSRTVILKMERTRSTKIYINNVFCHGKGSQILTTPQLVDITDALQYGTDNRIAIDVDNSYAGMPAKGIINSHMATEETQTNWNGILGNFTLSALSNVRLESLSIYPSGNLDALMAAITVRNDTETAFSGTLSVYIEGAFVEPIAVNVPSRSCKAFCFEGITAKSLPIWSEFSPALCHAKAMLRDDAGQALDICKARFGNRAFGVSPDNARLQCNGKNVFLRCETNCAVFPLTGYAPMQKNDWEGLFRKYQSYGVNTVRFHSWCPPKAAFDSADELGLYIQPELCAWNYSGMFSDEIERSYYAAEARAILSEYANHPSFVALTLGNELIFTDEGYEYADELLVELQRLDPTRLYSFGSNINCGGKEPTAHSDFFTGQKYIASMLRGCDGDCAGFINNRRPATNTDFSETIKSIDKPAFSFEVGQYQVFPDVINEPDLYTGATRPTNLLMIRESLKKAGITDGQILDFIELTGEAALMCYRMEIEAALRTHNMSGISLLGLQDFPGQGTALVGMINSLGKTKGYSFADPARFRAFFSSVVPLLKTDGFCYDAGDIFTGQILVSNHSNRPIKENVRCRLIGMEDDILWEKVFSGTMIINGEVTNLGGIEIPLKGTATPERLTLELSVGSFVNSYNIWVYPVCEVEQKNVYIAKTLDSHALERLNAGGKVLFSPRVSAEELPGSIDGIFSNGFWSTMFASSQPGTQGLIIDNAHGALAHFPSRRHTEIPWWPMCKFGRPINLDGIDTSPIVGVIDSFVTNRRLGLLFEGHMSKGSLVFSSMGLEETAAQYPEVRALRSSIISYMQSDNFAPQNEISQDAILNLIKVTSQSHTGA